MGCPSEYLAAWAQLWNVRDIIVDRTGLTPSLYPADRLIGLVDGAKRPAVAIRCRECCREDLLTLLEELQRVTIWE